MARRRSGSAPPRAYATTAWGRAMLAVLDNPDDIRRVNKARSYFRERVVLGFTVTSGKVNAHVQGSQLEPFDAEIRFRPIDAELVISLLTEKDALDDLLAVTRGKQPQTLASVALPTQRSDVVLTCSCPDDEPHCIHILALAYELAARIDATPSLALTAAGADVPTLLAHMRAGDAQQSSPRHTGDEPVAIDTFAPGALPPFPTLADVDVFTDLDVTGLARALRASGVRSGDVGEVTDELAELYAHIRPSTTDNT